ncbi:MAG: hypothetical protein HKP17_11310, partial [Ignavibacteriaceae bacterium]|nr:hypothetical protein [Ignavibacteriaceae bacterium]
PNCKISPRFDWRESYSADDIISRLKKTSFIKNGNFRLTDVYIASRFSSGRVREMVFELIDEYSDEIKISIFGNQIRSVLRTANNKSILWSTLFDISFVKNVIEIEGNGFGHGVGLCQYGAISLSRKGWDFNEILEHYFPGIEIKSIND